MDAEIVSVWAPRQMDRVDNVDAAMAWTPS